MIRPNCLTAMNMDIVGVRSSMVVTREMSANSGDMTPDPRKESKFARLYGANSMAIDVGE